MNRLKISGRAPHQLKLTVVDAEGKDLAVVPCSWFQFTADAYDKQTARIVIPGHLMTVDLSLALEGCVFEIGPPFAGFKER